MSTAVKKIILYVSTLAVIFFGDRLYTSVYEKAGQTYVGRMLVPVAVLICCIVFFLVLLKTRLSYLDGGKQMIILNAVTSVISLCLLLLLFFQQRLGHMTNAVYLVLLVTAEDLFDLFNSLLKK